MSPIGTGSEFVTEKSPGLFGKRKVSFTEQTSETRVLLIPTASDMSSNDQQARYKSRIAQSRRSASSRSILLIRVKPEKNRSPLFCRLLYKTAILPECMKPVIYQSQCFWNLLRKTAILPIRVKPGIYWETYFRRINFSFIRYPSSGLRITPTLGESSSRGRVGAGGCALRRVVLVPHSAREQGR